MILSDSEITELCIDPFKTGIPGSLTHRPLIDPFNKDQVEPASYDVALGNDFKIFERDSTVAIDLNDPADITKHVHIDDGDYFLLHPGEFVLGVTRERVNMPADLVSRIEGKSSVGRLGIMIHVTAGFIDPGFSGPITLEMASLHPLPVLLRPGRLIAQLSFHKMSAPAFRPYEGRYQNAESVESSKYGEGQL